MKLIVMILSVLVSLSESARILGLFHVAARSHYIVAETILVELARKGHDVTIVSPFKSNIKDVKFREIQIQEINDIFQSNRVAFLESHKYNIFNQLMAFANFTNEISRVTLKHPSLQNLMKSGEKFDVILLEPFGNEAFFGLQHIFNSHLIVLSTATSNWVNHYAGNVAPFSFVPHGLSPFPAHMNFYQRICNSLINVLLQLWIQISVLPFQKQLYKDMFSNVPDFEETIKNVSLNLVNSHVVYESPRPYLPSMVPVGGLHIKEPKTLPQDLQTFLDKSNQGIIYFSMGSNIQSKDFSKDKQQAILKTFSKLPHNVLWKYENETLKTPKNVMIKKWFPQTDILAHPNVKLFITHGGLLSSIEALYRGVPIIALPIYGDQYTNAANFARNGFGQFLYLNLLTEESFTNVINKVLNNKTYSENIKKTSLIIRDQAETPLNRATFWVEHIIKFGSKHLRSVSLDVPLHQYLLLDILVVLIILISIPIFLIYCLLKKLCSKDIRKLKRD